MARVVIDARESGSSTGRYIDKLIEHLHVLNPDLEFTILTKPDRLGYFAKVAPNFKTISSPYREFGLGEQLGLAWQLHKLRADLVHFNAPQQPLLYFKKSVTTIHDLTTARFNNPAKFWPAFKFKQLVYRFVIKIVARRAKALIAISNFTKDDLVKFSGVNPNKIRVIYEAAEPVKDPAEPVKSLASQKFIMYAGRPLPHKNLRRLIDAFAILRPKHPDLKLVLVGKKYGPYEAHARYVQKLGLKNVVFTDFVSDGQLKWLYQNCQAYVVPSLSEGFGLPGLEAMQAGAPVVSSDSTCLPEIYGDAALYFDPLNTSDMAAKLSRVLDDKKLAERLIQKGAKRVKLYSWAKTAEQTLALYNHVLPIDPGFN